MTAPTEDLIERLEAAEAGWPGLSLDVVIALDDGGDFPTAGNISVTTSLDAALALAERVLPEGRSIGLQQNTWSDKDEQKRRRWTCYIEWREDGENFEISPTAPTPALALCIAILRARALNTGSGEG